MTDTQLKQGAVACRNLAAGISHLLRQKIRVKLVRIRMGSPLATYCGIPKDRVPFGKREFQFAGLPAKLTGEFEARRKLVFQFDDVLNLCCEFLPEGYSLNFELFRQDGPGFSISCPDGREVSEWPCNWDTQRETWLDAVAWAREDAGLRYE